MCMREKIEEMEQETFLSSDLDEVFSPNSGL